MAVGPDLPVDHGVLLHLPAAALPGHLPSQKENIQSGGADRSPAEQAGEAGEKD